MWPVTLNVIDEHKDSVPDDGSVRYRPFVARERRKRGEQVSLVVRSLRFTGRRLVRLADRLETA
ncbi:hypothetical protein [Flindersiella endophytica]